VRRRQSLFINTEINTYHTVERSVSINRNETQSATDSGETCNSANTTVQDGITSTLAQLLNVSYDSNDVILMFGPIALK
jgi:hypothetical protein